MKRMTWITAVCMVMGLAGSIAGAQDGEGGLGLYAIEGLACVAKSGDLGGTFGIALTADIGELMPNMAIFPGISYWSKSVSVAGYAGSGYALKNQELGLQVDLHYYLNPDEQVNYYVGSGVGLFSSSISVEAGSGLESEAVSESKFGLSMLAGLEYPLGERTRFVGEGRYKIDGRHNQLGLRLGINLEMGR